MTEYAIGTGGPANDLQAVGVPSSFVKLTSNSKKSNLVKGQLNKVTMYPRILNEHVESSRQVQATVAAGNIVSQIFKASKDNITSLSLTLESAAGVQLDNFEGYANSTELQAAWAATGALAVLESGVVHGGVKAMALPGDVLGDSWVKTMAPANYKNFTGSLAANFTKDFNKFKVSVFIGDGVNTKSFLLVFNTKDVWNHYDILEAAMLEDQAGVTNVAAITQVGFRITDPDGGEFAYIDDIIATPQPGEIEIKLWDMGATPPVSGVTSISDGAQYARVGEALGNSFLLGLQGGKRLYHIHGFTAGNTKNIPTNELLTPENYYLIELKYAGTNVDVYGPDVSLGADYYANGFAVVSPDEATAFTAIGVLSDIMFGVFSTQDVYITQTDGRFDYAPGVGSDMSVFIEDTGMIISDTIIDHEEHPPQVGTKDVSFRPMFMGDGGKLEFYYNDDFTDSVTNLISTVNFLHEPARANG